MVLPWPLKSYLERHGFQVTIADGGGKPGCERLKAPVFDLMIVDIFMPHMRGFEVDPEFFHERAPNSAADRDVRLCLCKSRTRRRRIS